MERLQHDCAVTIAHAVLEAIGPCLREDEKNDAWREFYRIAKAGIESFVIQRNRELQRLKPSSN